MIAYTKSGAETTFTAKPIGEQVIMADKASSGWLDSIKTEIQSVVGDLPTGVYSLYCGITGQRPGGGLLIVADRYSTRYWTAYIYNSLSSSSIQVISSV